MTSLEMWFYSLYPLGGIVLFSIFVSPAVSHYYHIVSELINEKVKFKYIGGYGISSIIFVFIGFFTICILNSAYIHRVFANEYINNKNFIVNPGTAIIPLVAAARDSNNTELIFQAAKELHILNQYKEAKILYQKAAYRGHAKSSYNLGVLIIDNLISIDKEKNLQDGYFYLLLAQRLHIDIPKSAQIALNTAIEMRKEKISKEERGKIDNTIFEIVKNANTKKVVK